MIKVTSDRESKSVHSADHMVVEGRVPIGDRIEESINLSREEVLFARRTSGEIDAVINVGDDKRDG